MINQLRLKIKKTNNRFTCLKAKMKEYHLGFIWFGAILFRVLLDLTYITTVSHQYSYAGLYLNPNGFKYILSWFYYIFLFFIFPKKEKRLVDFFLHLEFIVIVAPMLSYYGLTDQSTIYMSGVMLAIVLQVIVLKPRGKRKVGIHFPGVAPYVTVFSVLLIVLTIIILLLWNGFSGLDAFNFKFLYSMRENATYPPLIPYFIKWITFALMPFFLSRSLLQKNYIASILLVFLTFIFYMVVGNKFIYLSLLVVIGVYILSRSEHTVKLLYLVFAFLLLLSMVIYRLEIFGDNKGGLGSLINSLFGIRFLFIPAQNKFLYYDFFSRYPKVFLGDGKVGSLMGIGYPYKGALGQLVFALQSGGRFLESNSTTGYFGDGYAQFGLVGVFLFSVLLAYIIKFIDACVHAKETNLFILALSMQVIVLGDAALLTTLLTNGLLIIILFAMVYSRPKEKIIRRGDM